MNDFSKKLLLKKIADGFSKIRIREKDAFYKHPTMSEEIELDEIYSIFLEKARKEGALTTDQKLELLDEMKLWTKSQEKALKTKNEYLRALYNTKSKLIIPKQLETLQETIKKEESELLKMSLDKLSLVGETCESYASKKRDSYMAKVLLFKDAKCSEKLLSEEEFDEMGSSELFDMNSAIDEERDTMSINRMKDLASDVFFYNLFCLVPIDSPWEFFGKRPMDLTESQTAILILGKTMRSVRENHFDIPDSITAYDEIIEYVKSSKEKKRIIEKAKNKDGFSMVGASTKDMKEAGIGAANSTSPFEMLRKSGKKSLTRADFVQKKA